MPSVPIGVYALRYWSGDPALLPYELRVNLLHNPPAFMLHTSFGGLALLLAPWQFVGWLRRTRPTVHRWVGRGYVGCALISGVAAYPVAERTLAEVYGSTVLFGSEQAPGLIYGTLHADQHGPRSGLSSRVPQQHRRDRVA